MNCSHCMEPMFLVYFGDYISYPVYRCLKCDTIKVVTKEPIIGGINL